jgi:hypothetical protein
LAAARDSAKEDSPFMWQLRRARMAEYSSELTDEGGVNFLELVERLQALFELLVVVVGD